MKTGPLLLRPSRIRRVSRRRRLVMVHPKSPCLTSLSRLGAPCDTLNPPPRGLCSGRQTIQVRWPLLDQCCVVFGYGLRRVTLEQFPPLPSVTARPAAAGPAPDPHFLVGELTRARCFSISGSRGGREGRGCGGAAAGGEDAGNSGVWWDVPGPGSSAGPGRVSPLSPGLWAYSSRPGNRWAVHFLDF
jgi:hypothetical protein